MDLQKIEVQDDMFIPFDWIDKTPSGSNLGRAEFSVCLKFKRGKVVEYFVFPEQQQNQKYYWHWEGNYSNFSIHSYDDLEDANVWLFYYCKTHKGQEFRLYAPKGSKYLWLSNNGIGFLKTSWKK
jgi:hypothetical protein